jgi:protein phosphatase
VGEADVLEKLVTASLSDVGRTRTENQDAWREARNALGEHLLVIADGMGGHRGGGEAGRMCVQTIEHAFLEQHDSVETRLRRGIDQANDEIYRRGLEDPDLAGMGATCVALVLCPDGRAWVAWVGDSRLYRLRAGKLEQITEDHSLVAEWQKLGVLSAEQAANHPKRNELTRAIGVTRETEPDVRGLELSPGDRFLLCSDGLWGVVDAATVERSLGAQDPREAARALIGAANERGGPDNVTVQIAWLPGAVPEPVLGPSPAEPAAAPPSASAPAPRVAPVEFEFELPERPAPLAPLGSRPVARAAAPSPERTESMPAARTPAARAWRAPGRGLHAPSAVLGLLAGVALTLAARPYLRWSSRSSAAPSSPSPPAASPAPAERAQPRSPEPTPPEPPPSRPARPPRALERPRQPEPVHPQPAAPAPGPQPAAESEKSSAPVGTVEWVRVPEPVPTSDAFELPAPVHAFLDAWLAALAHDDAQGHAALGFPTSASEFLRTQSTRESFRLIDAEISPRSTSDQTYVRLVLSYAFTNGNGRFRTEDELRFILHPTADGLRFAGLWSE